MKTVSIVLPLHRRTPLLANTLESLSRQNLVSFQTIVVEDRPVDSSGRELCKRFGVEYYVYGKGTGYNNVSLIYNCGIRKATGNIIVMESAECKFEGYDGLSKLVAAVENDELASAVPFVKSVGPCGEFIEWYNHPTLGARAGWTGFFCHAMHRNQLMKIGGYDEIFKGYGHDDDLLLFRMKHNGIQSHFVETLVTHQWHSRHHCVAGEDEYNWAQRKLKEQEVLIGGPNLANIGRDWGVL